MRVQRKKEQIACRENYACKNVIEPFQKETRSALTSKYKIPITSGEKC